MMSGGCGAGGGAGGAVCCFLNRSAVWGKKGVEGGERLVRKGCYLYGTYGR